MPQVEPLGNEVTWSKVEGTLGVVGVAPWATIEFCKAFYSKINASKDWHYPRVILDINCKLPSRGRYFQLGERDPSPYIAETIRELHKQGATVAVVPCNTAHVLYDKWAFDSPIPVPHIVRETLQVAREAGASTITPLTSSSLAEHDLFGALAGEFDLKCKSLSPNDQAVISTIIEDVKKFGVITQNNFNHLDKMVSSSISEETSIIFGCTELTILKDYFKDKNIEAFDSNSALSEAVLKIINIGSY
jgi:aspartate racemase